MNDRTALRGVVVIVVAGLTMGIVFNWLGLDSRAGWGVPWIAKDRVAEMPSLADLTPPDPGADAPEPASEYTDVTDPMAIGLGREEADLPEIPALDRPIQIELAAVKQYFDAGAAVFSDARDPDEYAAGHIPGAVSMPYEEVSSEPERLEGLETGGRPIIVYCGGGTCEVSINLAWDLIYAGHSRVVVYMGGFPEWAEAGYPVQTPGGGGA